MGRVIPTYLGTCDEYGARVSLLEADMGQDTFLSCVLEHFLMESDIANLCERLSLTEQEEEALVIEKEERPNKALRIRDISPNLFLAEFDEKRDKERVKHDGPWVFDKHLVLTRDVEGLEQIHHISFSEANFWVRIYDLVIMAHNWKMGEFIGRQLGKVIEVDIDKNEFARGEYLCIRVCLDIYKPLLRGKMISVGSYKSFWICFAYERLLNFCYLCGILGHSQKECSRWQPSMEAYSTTDYAYGPYLRAGNLGDYGRPIRDRQMNSTAENSLKSEPNSGNQNHGMKVPDMASDSTSAEIQEKLRGNYGKEDNLEMMEATYLEQLPVQNNSEIANKKEVIIDNRRIFDNLPMNTPADLQPLSELTKSSENSNLENDASLTRHWKRVNKTKALNSVISTPLASLKRSLDTSSENSKTIQTSKRLKGKDNSHDWNSDCNSQISVVANTQPHRSL
ncbi:uncharacterized protein LOC111366887 [Olea europaea var. sylvestris]|uniref:uncharacterized protein LOC111366887 n=1 Tax=Olea europaea var. sylvestris TaxID=158386 RepID=UPI000C1D3CEE|nr:uncharacterized protein LOC111366887 [Olea europaea var. sylvestris]